MTNVNSSQIMNSDTETNRMRERIFPSVFWKKMIDKGTSGDIATVFSSLCGYQSVIKFCRTTQLFYFYDKGIWKQRNKNDVTDFQVGFKELAEMLEAYAYDLDWEAKQLGNEKEDEELRKDLISKAISAKVIRDKLYDSSFQMKVIKHLPMEFNHENFSELLDSNLNYFAFSDCVYDLDRGQTFHHHPEKYIKVNTGYPFPKERNKEVEEDLWRIFNSMFHDPEDALYMLKTIAYCLHGDKSNEDLFFCWVGQGGNGKGCMLNLIDSSFGEYFKPLPTSYLTQKRTASSSAQPELANKKGVRIVLSTEPDDGEKFHMDKIKELSDPIEVRALYQQPFTFKPQFAIIIQANHNPEFTSVKKATYRRYRGIFFPVNFDPNPDESKKDKDGNPMERKSDDSIKGKLSSDEYRDSFMCIILDIYKEHIHGKKNLTAPKNVMEYVASVTKDNDVYGQFIYEYLEVTNDDKDKILSTDLMREFEEFVGKKVDHGTVGKKLKDLGLQRNKRNFVGVKLKPDAQAPPTGAETRQVKHFC